MFHGTAALPVRCPAISLRHPRRLPHAPAPSMALFVSSDHASSVTIKCTGAARHNSGEKPEPQHTEAHWRVGREVDDGSRGSLGATEHLHFPFTPPQEACMFHGGSIV
ncbi:hypothetical protein GUJ93_ZPchr0013g37049 [Zizania palustris]|uniref:Uncharacterized protein n=1 Tax=Zizania palustris TaxID=103762 RepID=A0A8J5WY53_ZIZPA|nr:hypothetical protein GUJ93_ZPchr0013g37049 [Zizania palustris]